MQIRYPAIVSAFVICLCACKQSAPPPAPDFLAGNIDSAVSPADDFFQYANGGWIKKTPIPNAESRWGIGDLVKEEIYTRLKNINDKAIAEKAAPGTSSQKIGDFWFSAMDTISIDKQGLQPIQPDLDKINAITSIRDIIVLTAAFHTRGIETLFTDYIGQDAKNSEVIAYQLWQGGLGMPNREYYFNTDARTLAVRKAYQNYITKTFQQLGKDSAMAAKISQAVYQLESRLAKSSRKLADLRDPYANYHKMDMPALNQLAGNLNWNIYLPAIGIKKIDSVIVGQPEFYATLSSELKTTSISDWKNYLSFHLVSSSASFLDKQSFGNLFTYTKTLTGASEPRPRWKRVLDAEENVMGELLGQLFVKEYFNETAKKRYSDLVEAIRDAYKDRIKALPWMTSDTKQKALEKLSAITKKVGYPDKWKDFSAMNIGKNAYVINVQKANEWWFDYYVNKLGKPVDRTEWDMSPQTYNAYYNPSNNEIVLPAGMFAVPGKKDEELDDAFIYGYAAASTIGHEITHGFDDQGRQFDAKGNLKSWWQADDSTKFTQRTEKIIRQFNEFNPVDTLHVNGKATQGENIADLGGLLLGLDAFKKTAAYKKNEMIDGSTPVQRYFLGYAYSWMLQTKKEKLASQLMVDVHAPAKERVNGPLANLPEFYEAFGVKPGNKMYRPDSLKVSIW